MLRQATLGQLRLHVVAVVFVLKHTGFPYRAEDEATSVDILVIVRYLSQDVITISVEGVDLPIKSVDVTCSLHRAGTWTVFI